MSVFRIHCVCWPWLSMTDIDINLNILNTMDLDKLHDKCQVLRKRKGTTKFNDECYLSINYN
jgi:hypothetical protein